MNNPCFKTLGKSFGMKTFTCSKKYRVKETLQKYYFIMVLSFLHLKWNQTLSSFCKPGDSLENVLLE